MRAGWRVLDLPLHAFTGDPNHWLRGPSYVGVVSSVGTLAWWVGAVACLVAGMALSRVGRREQTAFLLCAGLLTGWLALDDFFQVHERAIPAVTHLQEKVVFLAYGLVTVAFAWRFRQTLRATGRPLFGAAVVLLAASVVSDQLRFHGAVEFLAEDATKLLGIFTWTLYFGGEALRSLNRELGSTIDMV